MRRYLPFRKVWISIAFQTRFASKATKWLEGDILSDAGQSQLYNMTQRAFDIFDPVSCNKEIWLANIEIVLLQFRKFKI